MKKLAAPLGVAASVLAATPVYAQAPGNIAIDPGPTYQIRNLGVFIGRAISVALIVAGVLVFVFLVWGGIQWIMSGGDKGKTEEARSRITAALVGLAIVAGAYAVMQLIAYFFGIDSILTGGMQIPRGY
jgi:hypothetical protein